MKSAAKVIFSIGEWLFYLIFNRENFEFVPEIDEFCWSIVIRTVITTTFAPSNKKEMALITDCCFTSIKLYVI